MVIYIVLKSQMATENPVSFQIEENQTSKMRKQASPRSLRGLCTLLCCRSVRICGSHATASSDLDIRRLCTQNQRRKYFRGACEEYRQRKFSDPAKKCLLGPLVDINVSTVFPHSVFWVLGFHEPPDVFWNPMVSGNSWFQAVVEPLVIVSVGFNIACLAKVYLP